MLDNLKRPGTCLVNIDFNIGVTDKFKTLIRHILTGLVFLMIKVVISLTKIIKTIKSIALCK